MPDHSQNKAVSKIINQPPNVANKMNQDKNGGDCERRLKSAAGGARKVLHLPGKADWI